MTAGPPVVTARPADLTPAEVDACVVYLATLPLRELRKRQSLVYAQQGMAHEQRNDQGMRNLNAMADMLMLAVDRQCFGTWAVVEEQ